MPTIASTDGRFFVVTECVPQVVAAATAINAGGTLAALTSADLDAVGFPAYSFDDAPTGHPVQPGPIAWFATLNAGVPENTVYAMNLVTRQVFNIAANRAAALTHFVLADFK